MPRPNYGNAVKQRAMQFFTVLVDYANDELDCEERQLDNLQRDIQLHWQTEKRCVVRTKVRHLEQLARLAGCELTADRIKESIKCLTDFLGIIEDNRPSKAGSETWHFTLNLWHDRFDRSANLHRFETEWEQRKSPKYPTVESTVSIASNAPQSIDWFELIRSSLTTQQYQRITTNPLMIGNELKFSLEEVYVPLGLLERQPLTIFDRSDEGEAMEPKTIPDLDRLLSQIIDNPTPNRIGIIGEPGAGKTTCLQKLAAGLLDRQLLPIWISLADLQGESLETYLLQDWLKIATKKVMISAELQQDLADRFAEGKVWLLLDAVDEMASDASTSLANLARQLRGWVGSAHVILTCRSNIWDSGKNALEDFTTYRNLSLSYGFDRPENQIERFIRGWFRDRSHLADNLLDELAQPQYQRLRDAIKNPLRLALLCRSWLLTQGKLPSTKASLYQQFTDTIYAWKQDRFPTTLAQRQQLNTALGKLALAALSLPKSRFRLPHYLVLEMLEPDSIELALKLGWLNCVGISATTGDKIYAFYHPTFQEYFAARSITDWHYFFTSAGDTHSPIFSPYWQETILFWFGREDVNIIDKSAYIDALIAGDRGIIYNYRAYFLAASALAEFPEFIRSTEIIDRLLTWRFAEFLPATNTWQFYPLPIQDGARLALRQTDRVAAIAGLEKFVTSVRNPFLIWQAAHSLGKVFDPKNAIAVRGLINSLEIVEGNDLAIKICESLVKIDPNHTSISVTKLTELIHNTEREPLRRKAAFTLGKLLLETPSIDENNLLLTLAIDTLTIAISSAKDPSTRLAALDNLRQIAPTHPATQQLSTSKRTLPSSNRKRRKKVARDLDLTIAIAELEQKLSAVNNVESQRRYAYQLGKFQPGHPLAIDTLLQLMCDERPSSFYKRTGEYLKEIITDDRLEIAIATLKHYGIAIENGDRSTAALEAYKLLWYCAERLPDRTFDRIWTQ
jgi:hypothetical protein